MTKTRRRFHRKAPTLKYRKVFNIFTEGEKTEPLYFRMIKNMHQTVNLNLLHSKRKTSAKQILSRVGIFIKTKKPKKSDSIWIVLDVDQNSKSDLRLLQE